MDEKFYKDFEKDLHKVVSKYFVVGAMGITQQFLRDLKASIIEHKMLDLEGHCFIFNGKNFKCNICGAVLEPYEGFWDQSPEKRSLYSGDVPQLLSRGPAKCSRWNAWFGKGKYEKGFVKSYREKSVGILPVILRD